MYGRSPPTLRPPARVGLSLLAIPRSPIAHASAHPFRAQTCRSIPNAAATKIGNEGLKPSLKPGAGDQQVLDFRYASNPLKFFSFRSFRTCIFKQKIDKLIVNLYPINGRCMSISV
jgi:hypothetical protein